MDVGRSCKRAEALATFLCHYKWLLDSYVIEFYTEQHWEKLPCCWQEALNLADLREVGHILLNQSEQRTCHGEGTSLGCSMIQVYPLSLLAFGAAAQALALPRLPHSQQTHVGTHQLEGGCSQVKGIDHLYRRHVKPKKQHEIKCLAEVVSRVAKKTNCQNIIDMGSGQGHLARFLAYNYGLNVTAVEAVRDHLSAAAKFDGEVEKDKAKQRQRRRRHHSSPAQSGAREEPVKGETVGEESVGRAVRHIQAVIEPGCLVMEFLTQCGLASSLSLVPPTSLDQPSRSSSLPESSASSIHEQLDDRYVLVGLHTCGDLGATIVKVFGQSEKIAGLVSIGCCYMKLCCHGDAASQAAVGYPLSEFVRSLDPSSSLSYEAREVACHSIEAYSKQLQGVGVDGELCLDHLRVHSHRAAVETLLRKKYGLIRAQVRISKRISKLPFPEYAHSLLASIGLASPTEEEMAKLIHLVADWKKVVVFFILRLTLAPCVESLLLLDRAIFLMENSRTSRTHKPVNVYLTPIFDPIMSPRNTALIANR